MKVIIAEKPSVAREIARIVGATQKNEGYLSSPEYAVTWAVGHLITLSMPESYGFAGFKAENLPIIPNPFTLTVRQNRERKGYKTDSAAAAQIKVIRKLFTKCDSIIVATDAGREGELIFRYIYEYLDCHKPFERLWISSLTDKAIKEGLSSLKPGTDYDNLYYAAKARSQADWLVGINATQAVSIAAKHSTYSIGRVQTPTLCMIATRYLENHSFKSQPFWQLNLIAKGGVKLTSQQKWDDKTEAQSLYDTLLSTTEAVVKSIDAKENIQEPPLLYDLTTLQKEANTRHGFSADKTLSIAQRLYEAKLITYPRTGSRYLSDDVFEQLPSMFPNLKIKNRHSVDTSKVTDHHALLTIGKKPNVLADEDAAIFDMISQRIYEAFGDPCIKETTTITASCADILFTLKGSSVRQLGWRIYRGDEEENATIPRWNEGDNLKVEGCSMTEGKTKPKPLYTEASLLGAMEDASLGTPATRAAIIETLFTRDYIVRKEKSLMPTEKGLALHYIVRDMRIGDPKMTGDWETALSQIERGEMTAETFRESIDIYTRQITTELLAVKLYTPKQ